MVTFQFVQPTEDQKTTMQGFCDEYSSLAERIQLAENAGLITKGRGLVLARTKLEESAMWLNKAITNSD